MKMKTLNWAIAVLALAPLSALAGQEVEQRWDIDANASVSIENVAGKIAIEGWDKNEAYLTGELGDSVDELDINASSSSLQIEVVNRNKRNIDSTYLKLMVPVGASINASGVSAEVTVTGMDNDKLSASSVSGDVGVEAISQWVSIESVSGDVEFSGETGRISAESVSGDIGLSGISGEIAATTVSGDMELLAGVVESAKLETVSGDITMAGEISGSGRLSAESMSGDVMIKLPAGQNGLFRAESFSGNIDTAFGSVNRSKHGPGSYLKYVAGKDGAEIRVESFSGNIRLKQN